MSIQRYNKKQWRSELVYNIYNESNNTNTKSITDHYHLNSSWHLLSELKWNYGYSMILNKRLHFVPEYSRTRLSNIVYKDATISNGYGQNVYKCCGNMFNWPVHLLMLGFFNQLSQYGMLYFSQKRRASEPNSAFRCIK